MSVTLPIRIEGDFSAVKAVVSALNAVPAFFVALHQACAASREYERLSHLSDNELANQGLSRDAIPRHILQTYLGC